MAYFALAAGHGSTDPGATLGSRKEKNDNLKLSLAVEVELKNRGHKTVQYRTNDSVNCSASACKSWLAKQKADFGIVFHRNAFNKSANGVEVWSYKADENIAADLSAAIASASGLYNRGKKPNGAAWLNSSVRCCEPEVGFIDNANDNTKFDTNFNKIVTAICDTLEKHFGKGTYTDSSNKVIATGITKNYLNIRKTPVNGAVLTSMPTGSKCNIYSIADGWAYLEYNGYKGYSSIEYMTVEYVKKEEPKTETTTEVKKLYRVRTSWKAADSQQGAYENLDSAITKAKQTKCNVYDWNGKEVWNYTTWNKQNAPKPETSVVESTKESSSESSKETVKVEDTKPNTTTQEKTESESSGSNVTEDTSASNKEELDIDLTIENPTQSTIIDMIFNVLKKLVLMLIDAFKSKE